MKTWLCAMLALLCLACGLEQDISFDDPAASPPDGPSVTVLWGENEVTVFLDLLDKVMIEERLVCLLWDVLLEAGLEEEEIHSMRFDFENENGFRPSQKGCDPLEGELLALGYLDPDGLALTWDATLGLRGCYWVTQTAYILGEGVLRHTTLGRRLG
jgi:hypothetical protein